MAGSTTSLQVRRVLVCDPLAEEGIRVLREAEGIETIVRTGLKGSALNEALAQVHGVIVRSGTHLDAEALAHADCLMAICRAGVGVDNVDVAAATRKGVVVMNTPGGNTISTAEHTIAMILGLARNIAPAYESVRQGRWDRKAFTGVQLMGKALGVVGLGRVGLAVAGRAIAMGVHVIGYDPFLSPERAAKEGVTSVANLDDLLRQSDFISVHTPLNEETRGMIGQRELALTKPGVRIVNCARGGIVDEEALAEAIESGHVAGAALDVFSTEPPGQSRLLSLPQVLATPHLGASTQEAQTTVAVEAARRLVDFLHSGRIQYAVNVPPIDLETLSELLPCLDLARRLGMLQAQLTAGRLIRATVHCQGEMARRDTRLVSAAFTAGLLEGALEAEINLVNAGAAAKERGLGIQQVSSSQAGDFGSLIRTELVTSQGENAVSGAIFGQHLLRVVQIGPYRVDVTPHGILLVFSHRDVPGLIGFIGTICGDHNVNIAHMTVGRESQAPGGQAIAVLNLDGEPPPEALMHVRAHPEITSVRCVSLPPIGALPPWLSFGGNPQSD